MAIQLWTLFGEEFNDGYDFVGFRLSEPTEPVGELVGPVDFPCHLGIIELSQYRYKSILNPAFSSRPAACGK